MLTPQDIQNKEFSRASFRGYDMTVVDDFLDEIVNDYSALYKENAVLKSKIKVLVEKVEEYRSTEDSMRMALLTAQKMGDEMVADAKAKSDAMMAKADNYAVVRSKELSNELAAEEKRLELAKAQTQAYVNRVNALIAEQQTFLSGLSQISFTAAAPVQAPAEPEPAETREAAIQDTTAKISEAVSKIDAPVEELIPEDDDEPTKIISKGNWEDDDDEEDDEPVSPRPKFDFGDLKFGSNYGGK